MSTRVEFFIWSCLVNAGFSFAMMALVLFSRPWTKVKMLWCATCFVVGCWSFSLGFLTHSQDYSTAFQGVIAVTGASIWIPLFMFHMIHSLLKRNEVSSLAAAYSTAIFLSILNILGYLNDVRPIADFHFYTSAKPLYVLYLAFLYSVFIFSGYLLWKASKTAPPTQSKQLLFLLAGIELGLVGGQTTIPLVYGIQIFPWGIFFVPIYVLTVGYSMMKHQFLDFKLAAKKLSLSMTIYVCLAILVTPFIYPVLEKILSTTPEIRFPLFVLIFVYTMVIALGGLIYAFLIQKSFWLKSHMTMGLTHELKSPLANIRSALEYISENPSSTTYFDIIKRNTGRLEIFVNDLLNLASIQDETISLDKINFSMVDTINSVCEVYRPLIESKGMKLEFLHPNERFMINADEGKIRQVVSNLLSNAQKFSHEGTIKIELERKEVQIYCSVTDNGPGIAKENVEKVFDRFFQEKRSTKGAGLGLAIAKAWVEAHGGKIWIMNNFNMTCCRFLFTLPSFFR